MASLVDSTPDDEVIFDRKMLTEKQARMVSYTECVGKNHFSASNFSVVARLRSGETCQNPETRGLLLFFPHTHPLYHTQVIQQTTHKGPNMNETPSLYERLGGIYAIAAVVDDFVDRIMVDPRLNANPLVDEAHHKVPKAGFKYLVTEMVGWATGGPQKYTGKSMRESHEHLKITPGEWDAFMDDFHQTMVKFNVPAREEAELKAIVDSTYDDIVVGAN